MFRLRLVFGGGPGVFVTDLRGGLEVDGGAGLCADARINEGGFGANNVFVFKRGFSRPLGDLGDLGSVAMSSIGYMNDILLVFIMRKGNGADRIFNQVTFQWTDFAAYRFSSSVAAWYDTSLQFKS